MALEPIHDSVIWRLPHQEIIQVMNGTGGNDQFLIAPFSKHEKIRVIQGEITEINKDRIAAFFSGWKLPGGKHRRSVLKEDYKAWVSQAREAMSAGKFVKVVLARNLWQEGNVDIAALFDQLLTYNPNALVYAFQLEGGQVMIGATPETLLKKQGAVLYTEALGGTRTRDMYSEKETIEHGHIDAYVENVLESHGYDFKRGERTSRVAGIVEHLLTPFTATSRGYDHDIHLAYRLHPTAAVCGMPFQESYDFIRDTEGFDRKYYSGFLGPVHQHGDFSLFVNLRCAEVYDQGLMLYAGAGLNIFSDPEDEWDETTRKMHTVSQWI